MSTNGILSRLSRPDCLLLEPHLEKVRLPLGKRLERPGRRIEHIYFLQRGIASVVADGPDERGIEVGLIGREGMTGLAVVMDSDRSPYETFVQIEGEALCMPASNLRKRIEESPTLRASFLRYGHSFVVQLASTALANGRSKIEERLARWLLMAHDRIDGDEIALTHELLALMLGVRRPGVSDALKLLEKRGLIQMDRRAIVISDREGLKKVSRAYGAPEAEYQRLFD
ncbi:MAG TPA: Crp/Fnr family transcriptional regulator [Rhizomicrobium sp.]